MVQQLSSLLCLLHQVVAGTTENRICMEMGSGSSCNPGIKDDRSDSWLGHLLSIASNDKDAVNKYVDRFEDDKLTERTTTDEYYDLATDFYMYGWGTSFHFATRFQGETLAESIVRHEHFLASKLGLNSNSKVADLGMGVGGPLRNIQKFSQAHITGVTINDYQVRRAQQFTRTHESMTSAERMVYKQGDFTRLVPDLFEPESLDAVYYIESSCHIANRTEIFLESAKALKKGGKLFSYEWVMTDRYDPENPDHQAIKKSIEFGDGIEDLINFRVPLEALETSGFKVLEHGDLVDLAEQWYGNNNVPWYYDMAQPYAFSSFRSFALSKFGQNTLGSFLWLASKVGLVPDAASKTEQMLKAAGINLVEGGRRKIFTPMYYILAEKI